MSNPFLHLTRKLTTSTRMPGAIAMVIAPPTAVAGAGPCGPDRVTATGADAVRTRFTKTRVIAGLRPAIGATRRHVKSLPINDGGAQQQACRLSASTTPSRPQIEFPPAGPIRHQPHPQGVSP